MEKETKKNYCAVITAYKDANMLRSLLRAIHEKMWCFVHVDKKNWDIFKKLELEFSDVIFIHDFRVGWGGDRASKSYN